MRAAGCKKDNKTVAIQHCYLYYHENETFSGSDKG